MLSYLRYNDYPNIKSPQTKPYQNAVLAKVLPQYIGKEANVADVGANTNFLNLRGLAAREKWVIDPYDGQAGRGMASIPDIPDDIQIIRCTVGRNSGIISSGYFDVVFSSSVLEHIGQAEVKFDYKPTSNPPSAQEDPRNAFCRECFRIIRPGGVTIHTIDHAPRNLSYVENFLKAGFELLQPGEVTVDELLNSPDAVRQQVLWKDNTVPHPNPEYHSVLLVGFRKPL